VTAFIQTICFLAAAYFSLCIGYSIFTKFLGLFSVSLLGITGIALIGVFALIAIPFLIEIVRNSGLDPKAKMALNLTLLVVAIVIAGLLTPLLGPLPWIVLGCAFLAAPATSLVFKMMGNAILSVPTNLNNFGTQFYKTCCINPIIGIMVGIVVLLPVSVLIAGNGLVYGDLCSEKAEQVAPGANGAVPLQAGATGFSVQLGINGFAALLAKYMEKFNDFLEKSLPKWLNWSPSHPHDLLTPAMPSKIVAVSANGASASGASADVIGASAGVSASTGVSAGSSATAPVPAAAAAALSKQEKIGAPLPKPLAAIKNHMQNLCAPAPKAPVVPVAS
jgi:hypothetical protein